MSRAIWILCALFVLSWIFQWKLAEWKVREVKQASEHIEKKIDHLSSEIDVIVQQYMEDPEAWTRAKKIINR